MATLNPTELSKRNNLNIFLTRIRTGTDFTLEESNGQKVKLNKSILKEISSISHFDRFKSGRSIMLPTTSGQYINLTQIYKDSEFSGRTQATTAQEDAQIIRINQQLEVIFDKLGKEIIPLKVGTSIYQAGKCESTPGTPKCDFHFRGVNGFVGHVSHKAGSGPRAFQQWSGTSQRVEPLIYGHPETQAFINTLREMFPNGIPAATTVGRRIQDEKLQKMAVYGSGTYYDMRIVQLGEEVIPYVVAGYDVFRYDEKDEEKGYPINKDHYIVISDTTSDERFLVLGPEKVEGDHWFTELPKEHPEIEITEFPGEDDGE